jgi:hypothetical protein
MTKYLLKLSPMGFVRLQRWLKHPDAGPNAQTVWLENQFPDYDPAPDDDVTIEVDRSRPGMAAELSVLDP